jgi:subtilisin family serine protease
VCWVAALIGTRTITQGKPKTVHISSVMSLGEMMPDNVSSFRILAKMKSGSSRANLSIDAGRLSFTAEPLFKSISAARTQRGATTAATWHLLKLDIERGVPAAAAEITNPWDVCHQLLVDSGDQIEFAEPDLLQQWLVGRPGALATNLASAPSEPDKQNPSYPTLPDNFWYRDANHAEWNEALAASPDPGDGNRVRIAHLDTGYDPNHLTLPRYLNRKLQRNFVDQDRPNDASDDSNGILNNLGHGTGTLSILAGAGIPNINGGKPFGCAPYAEIVPVRVANSVVLFYNSAIARAFDYVHGLCKTSNFIQVITMSMGGLPSQAWADAINALYDIGVFVVTAAGNNYFNLPTHEVVYPARFGRVVAACGVMADQTPYADLAPTLMAGNYGPPTKTKTAISACTPNVPWARFGSKNIVDFDGNGTSAATPQIAAAAALWIQKNRAAYEKYPQAWMKVEAVRAALFGSAHVDGHYAGYFGNGKIAAFDALAKAPAKPQDLKNSKQPLDSATFPILSLFGGVGLAAVPSGREAMFELEILQLLRSSQFETPIIDFSSGVQLVDARTTARLWDELLSKPGLSKELRKALGGTTSVQARARHLDSTRYTTSRDHSDKRHLEMAISPSQPTPEYRKLRVYAYDPSLASDPTYFGINEARIPVKWEDNLKPGPVGEYIEVVDVDPASGSCYAPVDLNHPNLLASDGLTPSEANPQFHQQMCYAVAMRTIEHFELALGRKAMWSSRYVRNEKGNVISEEFFERLRIYPHALRTANSFYSSEHKALLLGYFRAKQDQLGTTMPGSRVFCAVSHDIIAHETTHALLDGLHRRYQESTNPDVLAFHEAFADIVALFQHFSIPEALVAQIQQNRGDLNKENLLAKIAIQFGQATSGRYSALRDALSKPPTRADYADNVEPHARGAVLVSAIFAAFLNIYRRRAADLIRLATGGTGVLQEGAIPDDLARRLTLEASKSARHVLNICIRALDYCPPVDITFGEYLRALITADYDAIRDDVYGYRVAFISAFRDRGIFPSDVKHLAVNSLLWEPPVLPEDGVQEMLQQLDPGWNLYVDRADAYAKSKSNGWKVRNWLQDKKRQEFTTALGFRPAKVVDEIAGIKGEVRPLEVHSVRPARRIGPDGRAQSDIVVEITQSFRPTSNPIQRFRGGCTLLIDFQTFKPRYLIRKRLDGSNGVAQQSAFRAALADDPTLRSNFYIGSPADREPFALLHGRH